MWPEPEEAREEPERAREEPDQAAEAMCEVQGLLETLGVEQDVAAKWLDGEDDPSFQVLTDDDIVDQAVAEGATGGGGDSDDSDEEDPPHTVSHSEACQALETLLKYSEQQEDISITTTTLLHSLLSQASRKRVSALQQKKISDFFTNENVH